MRYRLITAVATAVLTLGLSGCGSNATSALPSGTGSSNAPKCADVLQAGATVTAAFLDNGCVTPSGDLKFGGSWDCNDGSRLYGNDGLFGFEGEILKSGDAGSAAYKAAYDRCHRL